MASENGKGAGTTQESKLGFEPKTSYVPGFPPGDKEGPRDEYLLVQNSRDLSLEARKTLGNFLSEMSKGNLPNSPSANAFSLEGDSSEMQLYNRQTGVPTELVVAGKSAPSAAVKQFESAGTTLGAFLDLVEGYDTDAAAKFKVTSKGEYGSSENPFHDLDESGEVLYKANERKKGHTLLPNVKPVGSTKEVGNAKVDDLPKNAPSIQKRISNVLLNNRFNPKQGSSPYLTNFEKTGGRFGYSVQKDMGKYSPTAPDVHMSDLRKIAASLMIRATGHGGGIGLGFESDNPDSVSVDQVVLPSTLQLGAVKQSVVEMRAQNAYGAEKITKVRAELLSELDEVEHGIMGSGGLSTTSYGNLNSYLEPFNGPMPMGMLTQAVAGIIGLLVFSSLVNLITAGFWSGTDEEEPVDPNNLSKGFHRKDDFGGDMAELFGIPRIDHHFSNCMLYGIMSFCGFNFDPTTAMPQKILDSALNLAMAPGYYAIIFRQVIRDIEQITKAVSDLITKLPTLGITGGIQQIFVIVEAITTSATWTFLMTMVKIGNVVLNARHGHPRLEDIDVDELPVSPRTRAMKSRIAGGANESNYLRANSLAWNHRSNVSRYILPASLDAAYYATGRAPASALLTAHMAGKVAQGDGKHVELDKDGQGDVHMKFDKADTEKAMPSRLSNEYVEYIEDALEAEYMPFYFHDLRTNEIISFHAFLNSLSDSFSPEYTKVSGYGRMDSVKIYNKTERSIGIDFTVVATSSEDFDRMWWDINKLVTMVYPQWSRGKMRTQGDSGFIQPFSQIPTASPLIRLRFGDLIKSNYSKFSLARLFGVGTEAFKVAADDKTSENVAAWLKASNKSKKIMQDYTKRANTEPLDPDAGGNTGGIGFNVGDAFGMGFEGNSSFPEIGYQKGDIVVSKPGIKVKVRDSDGTRVKKTPWKKSLKTTLLKLKVTGFLWHDKKVRISKSEKQKFALSNKGEPTSKKRRKVKYICELTDPEATKWLPDKYTKKYKHLVLYHDQIETLHKETMNKTWSNEMQSAGQEPGGPPTGAGSADPSDNDTINKTNNFFTPKENFIVKAFESTRGRGMAGVITALSFDWGESTWDIEQGRRAPQWCKVSISFDPIHDIPLGLDHQGAMRAPAYNVGRIVEEIGGDPYHDNARNESARHNTYFASEDKKTKDPSIEPETEDKGSSGGVNIPGLG